MIPLSTCAWRDDALSAEGNRPTKPGHFPLEMHQSMRSTGMEMTEHGSRATVTDAVRAALLMLKRHGLMKRVRSARRPPDAPERRHLPLRGRWLRDGLRATPRPPIGMQSHETVHKRRCENSLLVPWAGLTTGLRSVDGSRSPASARPGNGWIAASQDRSFCPTFRLRGSLGTGGDRMRTRLRAMCLSARDDAQLDAG